MLSRLTPAFVGLALLATPLVAACSRTTNISPVLATVESNAVVVVGTGEALAPPDIARVTLGVEARAPDVDSALADANGRAQAVLAALVKEGIATKDVRTANLEIHFEQDPPYPPPPPPPPPPRPTTKAPVESGPVSAPAAPDLRGRYRVSNTVEVTVRDLDKLGPVLAAATRAGANLAYGLGFEIEEPRALEQQARAKALADARARAEELAAGSGVALGPVLAVSESGAVSPMPGGIAPAMMMEKSMGVVPVERGQVRVVQNVRVVYAIAGRWAER